MQRSFIFDDGDSIPEDYPVTEVCGGTLRTQSTCLLQTWTHDDVQDHRLDSTKLLSIIQLAETHLPISDLEVEIECEGCVISQYLVASAHSEEDTVIFNLADKHTDCLAKEKCGVGGSGCC